MWMRNKPLAWREFMDKHKTTSLSALSQVMGEGTRVLPAQVINTTQCFSLSQAWREKLNVPEHCFKSGWSCTLQANNPATPLRSDEPFVRHPERTGAHRVRQRCWGRPVERLLMMWRWWRSDQTPGCKPPTSTLVFWCFKCICVLSAAYVIIHPLSLPFIVSHVNRYRRGFSFFSPLAFMYFAALYISVRNRKVKLPKFFSWRSYGQSVAVVVFFLPGGEIIIDNLFHYFSYFMGA